MIDDRLLRVGSSNLNNRSMGFDTECDLAVEAVLGTANEKRIRAAILSVRRDLLSEHLGVEQTAFAAALNAAAGSLLKATEALRGPGRTLRPLEPSEVAGDESALAENELLDPERPPPSLKDRISKSLSGFMRA